jgi:hypothetical protein
LGNIPLPALSIQPPKDMGPDYLNLARTLGQQPVQMEQAQGLALENQQRRLALQDQQTLMNLAPKYIKRNSDGAPTGFDYSGFAAEAAGKVSPGTLSQLQTLQKNNADTLLAQANTGKVNLENQDKILTDAYNHLEGLRGEPDPATRQQKWQAAADWASKNTGVQLPAQTPDDKGLSVIEAQLGMHAQTVADAKTAAETQASLGTYLRGKTMADEFTAKQDPNSPLYSPSNAAVAMGTAPGAQQIQQGQAAQAGRVAGAEASAKLPAEIEARRQGAIAQVQAQANMYASNSALAKVPPHLVPAATADATKVAQDYADATSAADDMKTFIDLARSGNKIAYAYSPTEGVLTLNTARGVKRVNMPEIASYGGAGSAFDNVMGFLGKKASGASIPADVLNDMETLHGAISSNAQTKYQNKLGVINQNYGSNFTPVQMQSSASTGNAGGMPPGATHTVFNRADGKNHYTDANNSKDYGVAP